MTDKKEIEHIFRSNYNAMLIFANRMLHDEDVARDVVHDVFAKLLVENVLSVNSSYLLSAVRFACLKRMRSLSNQDKFKKLYAIDLDEIETGTWPDQEDITKLNDIIDHNLTEQTRKILKLKFHSRLTYREIADELSVSEVTVYKHLKQAINIIRQYFNDDER